MDAGLQDNIVIMASAVAAGLSFMAFVYPLMRRSEKRERYQAVIEKKRRDLFTESRENLNARGTISAKDNISASESVAAFFKVQKMMGEMGERIRDKMLQAGIRNPSAPIKYMAAKVILPVVFMAFAMLIMSSGEEKLSDSVVVLILLLAVVIGYKLPSIIIKNKILKRTEEISITFPDALDMMLICVQGGIGLEQAVTRIADEMSDHSEVLAEELGILSAEMALLNDRRIALQDFARRVGSSAAKSFASSLIQAEQYGTSVTQAMKVMAEELRDQRMAKAEQKAASLPPKLTVPMIAFFLPVLFVVILGPAILQAMETF